MSELRKDPVLDRWVIIAENRARRPNEFAASRVSSPATACPFCHGNEDQTPEELLTYPSSTTAGGPGPWRVRVIPNKFPALSGDVSDRGKKFGPNVDDPFRTTAPGVGAHEVIVESPDHVEWMKDLAEENVLDVLNALRGRFGFWKQTSPWPYGMWFKNVGEPAGATLAHLHSQLIVLPVVPTNVRSELEGSREYFHRHERCVYCDLVHRDGNDSGHRVAETPDLVAFCPFASRFPYEMWIVPRTHASHFEETTDQLLRQLATLLHRTLAALEQALERPAYNVLLHSAPFDSQPLRHYHWHMEILPRLSRSAGFEWGTGYAINHVPPDEASSRLRQCPALAEADGKIDQPSSLGN